MKPEMIRLQTHWQMKTQVPAVASQKIQSEFKLTLMPKNSQMYDVILWAEPELQFQRYWSSRTRWYIPRLSGTTRWNEFSKAQGLDVVQELFARYLDSHQSSGYPIQTYQVSK